MQNFIQRERFYIIQEDHFGTRFEAQQEDHFGTEGILGTKVPRLLEKYSILYLLKSYLKGYLIVTPF